MSERKTIHKWYWAWEFDKEERWLNEMAMSGWALDGVGYCTYHFIPCEPGEYTIRLEMRDHDQAYLDFMAETGAEYVGRMMKWIFFRRRTADGAFDLYSDIDSKIANLEKIGKLLGALGAANLAIGLANSFGSVRIGWINLLCATLLMYGLGRIHGRLEHLRQERLLHE
jgi:hypothetical protein